jgi:hypothetical protein
LLLLMACGKQRRRGENEARFDGRERRRKGLLAAEPALLLEEAVPGV